MSYNTICPKPLKYKILPLFIPHKGCKFQCVFCDQKIISGIRSQLSINQINGQIEDFATESWPHPHSEIRKEIAFYGGSFTALPAALQKSLLQPAFTALVKGRIDGIRVSTRPDCCGLKALKLLKEFCVKTIELGVQSMDNKVLELSGRGHRADASINAVKCLKDQGFIVGVQLMPGLPGEDRHSFIKTIKTIISLRPDFVRLYPTIVIKGTVLEGLYKKGVYKPLTVSRATRLCCEAMKLFKKSDIKVIRCGLQPTSSLMTKGMVCAGPFHPAFGELVESRLMLDIIKKALKKPLNTVSMRTKKFIFQASPMVISKLRGQKGINLIKLEKKFPGFEFQILPSSSIPDDIINITNEKGEILHVTNFK